jgi:1,2-diacylglycerol 3-alpha-glucosyltransferase
MHIAMVTDYYLPTLGGVQTAIKATREALTQRGHQVTIFCPLLHPSTDPDIVALPTSKVFKPDGFPFTWPTRAATAVLTAELVKRQINVVHVHSELFAALAGIRAAQNLRLPLIQSMHGRIDVYTAKVLPVPGPSTLLLATLHRRHLGHDSIPEHPEDLYMRTTAARRMWRLMINQANVADAVIVPSAHFADKLLRQGVKAPVHVISNVLEDSVVKSAGNPQLRNKTPQEPLRVMWCGRVSPEKRPEVFVEAVASAGDGVVANIYGDGVAAAKLRRQIDRLGVGQRVHMHGGVPQSEVLKAMKHNHVFVSSSHDFDNQPMVILEALTSGMPIVVSDPDLAEGLPPGGFMVAATPSSHDLAAALSLLGNDAKLLSSMSAQVVAHAHLAAAGEPIELLLKTYEQVVASAGHL